MKIISKRKALATPGKQLFLLFLHFFFHPGKQRGSYKNFFPLKKYQINTKEYSFIHIKLHLERYFLDIVFTHLFYDSVICNCIRYLKINK